MKGGRTTRRCTARRLRRPGDRPAILPRDRGDPGEPDGGFRTAIGTAARHPEGIRGLIALSAWTSLPDIGRLHFPGFLVRSMVREKYDSLAAAKEIRLPALVIHGELDNLIPMEHGKEIAATLAARWVTVSSAGHNDLLARDKVWEEIGRFLDQVASAGQP